MLVLYPGGTASWSVGNIFSSFLWQVSVFDSFRGFQHQPTYTWVGWLVIVLSWDHRRSALYKLWYEYFFEMIQNTAFFKIRSLGLK